MTERFRPSPDNEDIPRRSPSLEITVNGEEFELTWYNTHFTIYSDLAYRDMCHVQIEGDDEPTSVFFDSLPLIELLSHHDYPGSVHPEPTKLVLEMYYRYQTLRLEQELSSLGDE